MDGEAKEMDSSEENDDIENEVLKDKLGSDRIISSEAGMDSNAMCAMYVMGIECPVNTC